MKQTGLKQGIKKKCIAGVNCKNTCISRNKDCRPNISSKQKQRVKSSVIKIKTSAVDIKITGFIKNNGKISAAAKLLEDYKNRTNPTDTDQRLKAIKFPSELKEQIKDFYQITNKSLDKLKEIKLLPERSYADIPKGLIVIDNRKAPAQWRASVFHEMGHFLESSSSNNKQASNSFIKSKAEGPLQSLNSIMKVTKYDLSEMAYPGKFITPYVGKVYKSGDTEVISVGLEHFSSPLGLSKLFKADPQHFKLITQVLK